MSDVLSEVQQMLEANNKDIIEKARRQAKLDRESEAERARIVREALEACIVEPLADFQVSQCLRYIAKNAGNATLLKLWRLLK